MSSIIILLFAPSFLFFIHYFDFEKVILFYIVFSLFFLTYALVQKKKREDLIILSIYLSLLTFAYFFSSIAIIKFIPVFISMMFFVLFLQAALYKKELILKLTQKFYKKEFSTAEIQYLKSGDAYWAGALFINVLVQIILALWATDTIWAIYSSVGWYIYFLLILGIQIIYGRLYALKVSS